MPSDAAPWQWSVKGLGRSNDTVESRGWLCGRWWFSSPEQIVVMIRRTHACMHAHAHIVEREWCVQSSDRICASGADWCSLCVLWLPAAPQWQEISQWPTNHHRSCLHWYFLAVLHDELEAAVRWNCLGQLSSPSVIKHENLLFFWWIKQEKSLSLR